MTHAPETGAENRLHFPAPIPGACVMQPDSSVCRRIVFYMTLYVQDGGHAGTRPPAYRCCIYTAACTGCPLASRARVTSVPDP